MPDALFWLREALGGSDPDPELVVQTYRCKDCGHVLEITASDLMLV